MELEIIACYPDSKHPKQGTWSLKSLLAIPIASTLHPPDKHIPPKNEFSIHLRTRFDHPKAIPSTKDKRLSHRVRRSTPWIGRIYLRWLWCVCQEEDWIINEEDSFLNVFKIRLECHDGFFIFHFCFFLSFFFFFIFDFLFVEELWSFPSAGLCFCFCRPPIR